MLHAGHDGCLAGTLSRHAVGHHERSCVRSAGFTELERYGEYLAAHLGESLDGWWTHSHACNKSEMRSLPHAEGKPDHDYPAYRISNGNQMAWGPAGLSHMQRLGQCVMRAPMRWEVVCDNEQVAVAKLSALHVSSTPAHRESGLC